MANGKVCTGFSKPYVAYYNASGGTITYTGGRPLARGVEVSIEPDSSDDNKFYADNVEAESATGIFTGGTVNLTVDGLFMAAEKMILGLPDPDANGFTHYGDAQSAPNIGIGYLARYMSGGITTYVPTIIVKTKFSLPTAAASTQEDEIDWQTQELTATIMRGDDSGHNWKLVGREYATETDAEKALQAELGIYMNAIDVAPVVAGTIILSNVNVDTIQNDVKLSGTTFFGTLKHVEAGAIGTDSTAGNYIALQLSGIDDRITQVKIGFDTLTDITDDKDDPQVIKVADKSVPLVLQISDGTHAQSVEYDLSQMTLLTE